MDFVLFKCILNKPTSSKKVSKMNCNFSQNPNNLKSLEFDLSQLITDTGKMELRT